MRRRRILLSILLLLVAVDGAFLAWRWWRAAQPNALLTWVGIDSLSVIVPAGHGAARRIDGRWQPGLEKGSAADIAATDMGGGERRLVMISLEPRPTFGAFVTAIRDLRRRGICNILVREGGTPARSETPLPGSASRDGLDIPALVLCGHSIGDAGFIGTLAPDRAIAAPPPPWEAAG